jgi:hypothetical protein
MSADVLLSTQHFFETIRFYVSIKCLVNHNVFQMCFNFLLFSKILLLVEIFVSALKVTSLLLLHCHA